MLTLRTARAARNLTQEEAATLAGIRRATLADVERGRSVPTARTIRRLADVLHVAPGDVEEFSAAMKRHAGTEGSR